MRITPFCWFISGQTMSSKRRFVLKTLLKNFHWPDYNKLFNTIINYYNFQLDDGISYKIISNSTYRWKDDSWSNHYYNKTYINNYDTSCVIKRFKKKHVLYYMQMNSNSNSRKIHWVNTNLFYWIITMVQIIISNLCFQLCRKTCSHPLTSMGDK